MKRLILISAVVYSLFAIAGNFSTHSISASGESKLSLSTSTVNVEPGKRFDISVIASSPSTYNSAQIDIKYNPERLNLIKATPGDGLPSIANNEHNSDKGLVNLTLYKIGGTSGNADLLKMTFEGLAGTSRIDLLDSSVIVDNGVALASGGSSTTVTVTDSSNESSGETNTDNTYPSTQNDTTSTDSDNVVESNNESDSVVSNSTTPESTSDPAIENPSTNESNPSTSSGNVATSASQENLNSSVNTNQAEATNTEKSSIADELPNTGINNMVALASVVSLIGYCINVLRIKFI